MDSQQRKVDDQPSATFAKFITISDLQAVVYPREYQTNAPPGDIFFRITHSLGQNMSISTSD